MALRHWLYVVPLLLLAFALRLHQLDAVPLRGDEAFSAQYWAGLPLTESLQNIATIEPHPPLTYAIFSLWGFLFGIDHATLLRLLPVLANMLGVAGIYLVMRLLANRPTALIATLIGSFHPFFLWHAQDFRNYALWNGLTPLVIASALLVLRHHRTRHWFLFITLGTLTTLVFYFEAITLAILWLYGVIRQPRTPRWLTTWTGAFTLMMIPAVLSFLILQGDLIMGGGYGGNTGGLVLSDVWQRFLPTLLWGDTYTPDTMTQLGTIATIGLLSVTAIALKNRTTSLLLPLMFVYLPIIAISLISLRVDLFHPRYILMAGFGFVALLAVTITSLGQTRYYPASPIIFILWSGIALAGVLNYFQDDAYRKAPDWHELLTYVADKSDADSLIIQVSVDAAFGYYYDLISPRASQTALPTHPNQSPSEIESQLQHYQTQYDRLWVVGTPFSDWQSAGIVEAWMRANMQAVRHITLRGMPAREYASYQVALDDSSQPLATFNDVAEILDVTIHPLSSLSPNLTLEVYWRTIAPTPRPLTSFVHLIGAMNPATHSPLWAQDDHPPQNGRIMTDTWTPDLYYRDVYTMVISDLPAGDYQIIVGFYDEEGRRSLTTLGEDTALLGTITLP